MMLTLLMAIASPDEAVRLQPESARAMVIANCGIDGARLRIDRDEGAAMTTLTVTDSAPLSEIQLSCYGETLAIAGMHMPDPIAPAFEDDRLGEQYDTYLDQSRARIARQMALWARKALREAGLLKRFPRHDPKSESLGAFAIRIERFCGAHPGSVLIVQDNRIDLASEVLDGASEGPTFPSACATNVAIVAGHNPFLREPPPPILH